MRSLFLALAAAIGGFLFGFDSGVINGTVNSLQKTFGSTSVGTGFNVASMLIGCALGALFAGTLADRFGRKPILVATAIAFAVSAWGSGIADTSLAFVLYRALGGLAVGAASIICPAYISEIAPPHSRGRLASMQQLMIVLGLFAAFLNNYLIAKTAGSPDNILFLNQPAWRWMFWAELIPSALFLAMLVAIPESPRYLVSVNKLRQAAVNLRKITPAENPDATIAKIQSTLRHRPKIADLFDPTSRRLHPVIWIGIALSALQQLSGINVVFYYGATLWQSAGFSADNALLQNVITGSVNIACTLVAISLIDKIGRRPLLIAGSVGMTLSLAALALLFFQGTTGADGNLSLPPAIGTAALIVANTYVLFFAATWGPVMWVLLGEIFPNQFRGAALALAGMTVWTANFAITMTFPALLKTLGLGGSYSIYATFAAISLIFTLKYIPETKGKSLENLRVR